MIFLCPGVTHCTHPARIKAVYLIWKLVCLTGVTNNNAHCIYFVIPPTFILNIDRNCLSLLWLASFFVSHESHSMFLRVWYEKTKRTSPFFMKLWFHIWPPSSNIQTLHIVKLVFFFRRAFHGFIFCSMIQFIMQLYIATIPFNSDL